MFEIVGRLVLAGTIIRKLLFPPPAVPAVSLSVATPAKSTRTRFPLESRNGTHAKESQPPVFGKVKVPMLVVVWVVVPTPLVTNARVEDKVPPPEATRV